MHALIYLLLYSQQHSTSLRILDFRFLLPLTSSAPTTFGLILATSILTACSPLCDKEVTPVASYSKKAPLPEFINDPYEATNRRVWAVNQQILKRVINPTARTYKAVVPRTVRGSIKNFDRNITYPGRLVNNLLQGRWAGAKDETTRFISNTTVGIGGILDPATKWGVNKSEANFNQTFSKWGWKPKSYVMLPLLGPSDNRHAVSLFADRAADPLTYASQPYRSAAYLTTYDKIASSSEFINQLLEIESDAYSFIKYGWSYTSKQHLPSNDKPISIDSSSLQTLAAATFTPNDRRFLAKSNKVRIKIPTTRKKLEINYWLQKHPAPLVYILPGLAAHRVANISLTLAEMLYEEGYSVVSTTSIFHPEFMENASTADLPAYAPTDNRDLLVAMTEMDKVLVKKHPARFTKRALIGMSMGGYMSLKLSIRNRKQDPDYISFDRYVAVNSPVNLIYGANLLDSFIQAPMEWPETTRQQRVNNTLHKAAANSFHNRRQKPKFTFDAIESKYLVGLVFRLGLRDILYSTQTRNNQGVIKTPLTKGKREPLYQELMNYSYTDYFYKFAAPYYQTKGRSIAEILRHANLRNHTQKLRDQKKVRIITNRNDFLLQASDITWLKSNFTSSQLTIFPQGGHLGNLNQPAVKDAIYRALDGLK